MAKQRYIAIIGDIHHSRLIENRENAQVQLKENLKQINKKYSKNIVSTFSISMGDSFQGLLDIDAPFTQIMMDIELFMLPIDFKFGVGIGEINTEIDKNNSQLNDGPAYHRARKALEIIEQNKQKYATSKTNTMLLSKGEETSTDYLINSIFSLNTAIKNRWSTRQKEIVKAYLKNNENQYEAANALDIGQSSVSKALKSTDFYTFKSSLDNIQKFMKARVEGDKINV